MLELVSALKTQFADSKSDRVKEAILRRLIVLSSEGTKYPLFGTAIKVYSSPQGKFKVVPLLKTSVSTPSPTTVICSIFPDSKVKVTGLHFFQATSPFFFFITKTLLPFFNLTLSVGFNVIAIFDHHLRY